MDTPSAGPPAPAGRVRRLGPVNPLTIAIGLVLLAAGGAFGWRLRTEAPRARPTPEAAAAALALERLETAAVCAQGAEEALTETALRAEAGEGPRRLSDRLPDRSPIPGFGTTRPAASLDPARDPQAVPGAVEYAAKAYGIGRDEQYTVDASRYLTRQDAAAAFAAMVDLDVCERGATAFAARGRPGLVVMMDVAHGWAAASWASGSDRMLVVYGGWQDPDLALTRVAAVAGDMTFD